MNKVSDKDNKWILIEC